MTEKDAASILSHFSVKDDGEITQDTWYSTIKQDIEEAIDMAIKALLEQEPRWIPVSERLPEIYRDLYDNDYHNYKASDSVLVTVDCQNNTYIRIATYTDNGWISYDDYCLDHVAAWMPLPKPYKPQESEVEE